MKGSFWIVGVLLLVGMFFGVRMVFENSHAAPGNPTDIPVSGPPENIIAWGNFDVERGVALLYPRQSGNVIGVHSENTKVKQGDVLLRIDDKLALLKIDEAEADVNAGEQQLAEARKLTELYQLQVTQQKSALAAVGFEIEKFKRELDSKIDSLDPNSALAKTFRELAGYGLAQLREKKKTEEAKLKQIELQDAHLKIKQAEVDLSAKKIRLNQAREMLKHFQIVAPDDGYVLRVHVRKGETLGPNPRIHALEFLPDAPIIVRAEVLQEWGRFVKEGQAVTIEDDTYKGPEWKGKVKSISHWYAPTRSPVIEPFRYNDVRTLECIIEVTDAGGSNLKPGQRVRAKIKIDKP